MVFLLGVLGGLLALVQVRFFGYAVGLGWPVRGLGSNSAVNADGLQPPVTLVRLETYQFTGPREKWQKKAPSTLKH